MALPVQSVRARPEHREILQTVADLLRQGQADVVTRLLADATAHSVGPFRDEASAIAFLRDRLTAALQPKEIWLFGSRARGDARPDSDFDILVVLPDDRPAAAYRHEVVSEPLAACGLGYDVVPCRWSDYQRDRNLPGTLVHNAVKEGRRIYRARPRAA